MYFLCVFVCNDAVQGRPKTVAVGDTLRIGAGIDIVKIAQNTYLHITYMPYGDDSIPCNGLIYVSHGEAAVFDAPLNYRQSAVLSGWIADSLKARIKFVVVNHHHEDCIGGIDYFTNRGIETWSQRRCCKLAKESGFSCTIRYFDHELVLQVGNDSVICWWPGKAHTADNIVCYLPTNKTLFAGCMVRAMGAGKGNLKDAYPQQWAETLKAVQDRFGHAQTIIPGHGAPGGSEIIEYTIGLFSPE
ncbi:MAG: BcII family subclass B1 metallo-beta-lactamase [Salibacteraceae bacterium]